MADPQDPAAGGEEAFAYLLTTQVPQVLDRLLELQGAAIDKGEVKFASGVAKITERFLTELNHAAVEMAGLADGYIIAKLFETQSRNRPITGQMLDHIKSEPGPLGSVRVALVSELDKIINERGDYHAFWRAQEFGTGVDKGGYGGGGIPSQEGRFLFGTFDPSGTPPESAQQGLGKGHDLAFIPFGSAPGEGRISVDLPGRHFLRDGSAEAAERYIQRMGEIQTRTIEELRVLLDSLAKQTRSAGRTFIGRVQA